MATQAGKEGRRAPATKRKAKAPAQPAAAPAVASPPPGIAPIGEQDVFYFREGTHGRLYRILGCQLGDGQGCFTVWAPNARSVSVVGDFNGWDDTR